jgi:hypothetical protein
LPTERIPFKIKTSAKLFDILSSGIYKDKILAVIREYSCNAFDAHVDMGKIDVPFTIRMPSLIDPTFSIEDEGPGIDPTKIGDIFWTYGESSKTDRDDQIGALGLGSKSAFAYTKSSFIIKNRFEGIEYTYFCFINESGMPDGSLVSQEATERSSGITVEFAVRSEDVTAFHERAGRFFKYWNNVKPTIVGYDSAEIFKPDPEAVIKGNDWYVESSSTSPGRTRAIALMGNVQYPIESESIPNIPNELKLITDNPFVITFKMGALGFASSREALSYDENTCSSIISRLEEVRSEIAKSFTDKVFTKSTNHVEFYREFYNTYAELRKVLKISSNVIYPVICADTETKINELFTKLLVNSSYNDSVYFNGTLIAIKDLISGVFNHEVENFQDFGLYILTKQSSRSSRLTFKSCTGLKFSALEEIKNTDIYPSTDWRYRDNESCDVGEVLIEYTNWRSRNISTRNNPGIFENIVRMLDKFKVSSKNSFKIEIDKDDVIFVLNDVGSVGDDRFKEIVTANKLGNYTVELNNAKIDRSQLIFVNFSQKICTVSDVEKELTSITSAFSGSKIVKLSALPDLRSPAAQEKPVAGSIKTKVLTYCKLQAKSLVDVSINELTTTQLFETHGFVPKATEVKTVMIDDLKKRKVVGFVIKKGHNDFVDEVGGYHNYLNSRDAMILGYHFGAFDDALVNEELPILILTRGQYEGLLKKGVNLKTIKSLVAEKDKELQAEEDSIALLKSKLSLNNIKIFKDFDMCLSKTYKRQDFLSQLVNNNNSLFKELFSKFIEQRKNMDSLLETMAKVRLTSTLKSITVFDVIHENKLIYKQIYDNYPLLEYINFNNSSNMPVSWIEDFVNHIIFYINQVDAEKTAVKEQFIEEIA